jgi:hypothetical protein
LWKRKQEEPKKEECGLAMYVQDKRSQWYIDSGCSKHMTWDQIKFPIIRKKKEATLMILRGG